jgi:hypothetical protein
VLLLCVGVRTAGRLADNLGVLREPSVKNPLAAS